MQLMEVAIDAVERGWVPDRFTRLAIRQLCQKRLAQQTDHDSGQNLIAQMRVGEIAQLPEKANDQHYEVPAEFFRLVLGPRHKYSCCFFEDDQTSLAVAEQAALKMTCERAELVDGQRVLELGCGWGSLSLWIAEHYPNCEITAVSNSHSQRKHIEATCKRKGYENLNVVTRDINQFSTNQKFDRVISVEMFEHMRNYKRLLANIASWMVDDGKLFVHVFCNARFCYAFETEGAANWMGRHFFSGGIMPSASIFDHFPVDLVVMKNYRWSGCHYQRTLECWLENLDARREQVKQIFQKDHHRDQVNRMFHRWRMFFMASAELFGYRDGEEWFVSQSLFEKP